MPVLGDRNAVHPCNALQKLALQKSNIRVGGQPERVWGG